MDEVLVLGGQLRGLQVPTENTLLAQKGIRSIDNGLEVLGELIGSDLR